MLAQLDGKTSRVAVANDLAALHPPLTRHFIGCATACRPAGSSPRDIDELGALLAPLRR